MFTASIFELLTVILIALILLGPKEILDLSKVIAKTFNELRNISKDLFKTLEEQKSLISKNENEPN